MLQETLSGHQVVKSFGAEEVESNRFRDRAERLRRSNLRYVAQQALASPLIEFFAAITIVGLLSYARQQIKLGAMSTGEFTRFIVALLVLYEPVTALARTMEAVTVSELVVLLLSVRLVLSMALLAATSISCEFVSVRVPVPPLRVASWSGS